MSTKPVCPRCRGFIPSNERPGAYPGAWSRRNREAEVNSDHITEVCSACGTEEALLQFGGFDLNDEVWPIR